MPSNYSSNLRLELIASGEQGNTWGNTTNNNLGSLLEQAITGITQITSLPVTLTALNGAVDQSRALYLKVTAPLSADGVITAPASSKMYIVKNETTSPFNITIKTSTSTGVIIPYGRTKIVYYDNVAGDYVEALNSAAALYLSSAITTDTQATTKKYVDDQDYLLLPRDGSRNMTGDYLPLKNSTLIAGAPATSATPKGYVDGLQVTAGTGLTGGGTFAANSGNIPLSLRIATDTVLGGIKPNATQFTVDGGGVLFANAASTSVLGCVKVDGSTITINGSGVISAAGTATGVTSLATTAGSGVLVNGGTGPASAAVTVSADTSVLATKTYVTSQGYVTSSGTVNYANTAGSAPANGGNSSTVGGLSASSFMRSDQAATGTTYVQFTRSGSNYQGTFGILFDGTLGYAPGINAYNPLVTSTYAPTGFIQTTGSGATNLACVAGTSGRITMQCLASAGAVTVYTDNNGQIYNYNPSDRALKENITPYTGGLSVVETLNPVKYAWVDKEKYGDAQQLGLIAQEVDPVVPEAVQKHGEDGVWGIEYIKLIPVLISAIQELSAEVKALKGA